MPDQLFYGAVKIRRSSNNNAHSRQSRPGRRVGCSIYDLTTWRPTIHTCTPAIETVQLFDTVHGASNAGHELSPVLELSGEGRGG